MLATGTQYVLRAGRDSATITSLGATLRTYTRDGRDLVVPSDADVVRECSRGVTLVPWPNRVVGGSYTFDGVTYQLGLSEPARGHALHGLLLWTDYEPLEHDISRVVLRAFVHPQVGYPWRIEITTTFELSEAGLKQTIVAKNLSSTAAPFGAGPHPYLIAGEGSVDDWTLELPASEVLTATPELAPIALEPVSGELDFREARPVGSTVIDHAFTGLSRDADGVATVRVTTASGSGIQMSWDTACPWVQIYTDHAPDAAGRARAGLAVEPMTCSPDAFNDASYPFDTGLISLEPGASTTASWTISVID